MIHPNALQDFYGITNHLTIEEIAKEVEEAGEGVVVQWNRNEIGGRQKHRRKGR